MTPPAGLKQHCTISNAYVKPSRWFCRTVIRLHLGFLFSVVVVKSAPEKVRHRVTHCPYTLAILPLPRQLQDEHPSVRQAWLADDSAGSGALHALRQWWDPLCSAGADYGYNTNSMKTVWLVKADLMKEAVAIFEGTGVRITLEGVRYLGCAVGEPAFLERFFLDKVEEWTREIQKLATFALTEPHGFCGPNAWPAW